MPGTRSSSSQMHLQGVKFQVHPKNLVFQPIPKGLRFLA